MGYCPLLYGKEMENIEITFKTILQLFGALAILAGGIKVIVSALNPYKEIKAKVKAHDNAFAKEKERIEELDDSLERIEKEQKVQGKALMVLISHIITGNDVEKLKDVYKKMVDHYIDL